jgi:hypothetical protein
MVGVFTLTVKPAAAGTPLVAEKVVDGLKFTMSLQNTTFKPGEPINITFTVTNIGRQTISYVHSFPEFDFIVYNSSISNLYQWTSFKMFPMIVWNTHLDPGKNYTSVLTWPQTCNQTVYKNEGVPVSPGQYSIIGLFLHFGLQTTPLQVSIGTVDTGTCKPVSMMVASGGVGVGIAVPVVILLAAVLTKKNWHQAAA